MFSKSLDGDYVCFISLMEYTNLYNRVGKLVNSSPIKRGSSQIRILWLDDRGLVVDNLAVSSFIVHDDNSITIIKDDGGGYTKHTRYFFSSDEDFSHVRDFLEEKTSEG